MRPAGHRGAQRLQGCNGIGRHIAQRLVADGETVVDVPAKLSARARVFDTGQGRKTDPVDAHSVAVAALPAKGLRQVTVDDVTVVLRLLADRRDGLGHARTDLLDRIHQLPLELLPCGAEKFLSAPQARALLNTVRPRDLVGRTRRRLASELITELVQVDKKIKAADKELTVETTGSSLQDLHGIGPSGTARLIGDVADISRFATCGHFASWNGTAPLDAYPMTSNATACPGPGTGASPGPTHMAVVQLRHDTDGRAYYRRKLAAGKTPMEAMRALKRRLSDIVYKQMIKDAKKTRTGPGGHVGATLQSSAADRIPMIDTSEQSLPGPAEPQPRTPLLAAS
ncbi:IS110 family transposase [Micromonospora sp. CPCC 205556]|uniref:IS110 family transposase n=1 Tax=Micromonospora sp. CPCC 205556 TaxID=3122398 RepID=UPI002FEEA88B